MPLGRGSLIFSFSRESTYLCEIGPHAIKLHFERQSQFKTNRRYPQYFGRLYILKNVRQPYYFGKRKMKYGSGDLFSKFIDDI